MNRRILKRVSVCVIVSLSFLAAVEPTAAECPSEVSSSDVKLIVVISVDQMRYDYLTRFEKFYNSGFRTLLEQGAVFTNAFYRHANTETGPGHAVILTGQHPSHTGIVANDWFHRPADKVINAVENPNDAKGQPLGPHNLEVDTLGDALKAACGEAKVFSLAIKDRAAILMGGNNPNGAYWFDNKTGTFVTSQYSGYGSLPGWLNKLNASRFVDRIAGKQWNRLLFNQELYEKHARNDEFSSEAKPNVFPHIMTDYKDLEYSPFGDLIVAELAKETVYNEQLGDDNVPDLLAIGFSSPDRIGHFYGPWSQEAMDEFLRLDLTLGSLLDWLESQIGSGNLLVVFTADHGATPIPEYVWHQGEEVWRIRQPHFERRLRQALDPGTAEMIKYIEGPGIYLDQKKLKTEQERRDAEERLRVAALTLFGVEAVYTRAELNGSSTSSDNLLELYRNSYYAGRSPDVIVRFKPHYLLSKYPTGTGHGTPYEYDRHVPVIFIGPTVMKGSYPDKAGPEDIVPTLACILGLNFPKEPDSRLLAEILKKPTDFPKCQP